MGETYFVCVKIKVMIRQRKSRKGVAEPPKKVSNSAPLSTNTRLRRRLRTMEISAMSCAALELPYPQSHLDLMRSASKEASMMYLIIASARWSDQ